MRAALVLRTSDRTGAVSAAAPPRPPGPDELEALIREARARQRKRWLGAVTVVALLAGGALVAYAVAGSQRPTANNEGAPRPTAFSPRCRTGQLRLSEAFGGAAAGSDWFDFAFTNVSATSCTLRGWPSVELRFAGGRLLVIHVRGRYVTQSGRVIPVHRVTLRPSDAASFALHAAGTHNGGRACPQTGDVAAIPPGDTAPLPARLEPGGLTKAVVWACRGKADVTPLAGGATRIYNAE